MSIVKQMEEKGVEVDTDLGHTVMSLAQVEDLIQFSHPELADELAMIRHEKMMELGIL